MAFSFSIRSSHFRLAHSTVAIVLYASVCLELWVVSSVWLLFVYESKKLLTNNWKLFATIRFLFLNERLLGSFRSCRFRSNRGNVLVSERKKIIIVCASRGLSIHINYTILKADRWASHIVYNLRIKPFLIIFNWMDLFVLTVLKVLWRSASYLVVGIFN